MKLVANTVKRRVVSNPDEKADRAAHADGLTNHRDLYQMRMALPLKQNATTPVATRAFRPGTEDEPNWIAVNNAAFATHPDQSAMTLTRLHEQMAQEWFDPEGFRLYEHDSNIAAFCWTKAHPADQANPAMGEIYVIGVAPISQGRGLGKALTIAGLEYLASRRLTTAMLYVESDNDIARSLYESLGFTVHHRDRVYESPHGSTW